MRRALPAFLLVFLAATLSLSPQAQNATAQQAPPAVPAPAAPVGPGPAAQNPPALNVVVLDPAHGGPDTGARGPSGVMESDVVLDFARVVRVALEAQGFRVVLTREGNQDPSFDDRSAIINGIPDAVFVSLHVSSTGPFGMARAYSYFFPNAAPGDAADTARRGLVEWDLAQKAWVARSQRLAELTQIQLAQKFQGSPELPFQVPVRQLRTVAAPAIAVELSSVATPDAKKLAQMGQPLADAIARAAVDYRTALRAAAAPGPAGAPSEAH